jgi:hypothetical protein
MLKTVQSAGWKPLLQFVRRNAFRSFTSFSPVDDHASLVKQPTVVKKKNIKPYINIEIREEDLEEIFSRSSGPGGQSVNKTNSRVQLTHKPTNTTVTCQEQRDLFANRRIARKKLKDQLDLLYNGDQSKVAKKISKAKRRKSKAKRLGYRLHHRYVIFSLLMSMCRLRRAKQKYGSLDEEESECDDPSVIEDECEEFEECEESRADDVDEDRMVINEKSMDAQVPQSNKSRSSKS